MKNLLPIFIGVGLFLGGFYFFTGFFVIQPIGAVPDGATVWYFRYGVDLPFISSVDGFLYEKVGSVSIFSRAMAFATVGKIIADRKILVLPYSEILYLISTRGVKFSR